jgi:hypothetical protein
MAKKKGQPKAVEPTTEGGEPLELPDDARIGNATPRGIDGRPPIVTTLNVCGKRITSVQKQPMPE